MFCQDLELQAALTGRKKPVLGQKKAANNFFDADHHFETHKIGFKNFDQQSDKPKRGLEPVKLKNWIITFNFHLFFAEIFKSSVFCTLLLDPRRLK